jgi:hypothetical protein
VKGGRRAVLGGLLASAALAGCGTLGGRRLHRPPEGFDRGRPRPPVVFVHGAFGSRLVDRAAGREVWPVSSSALLLSDYSELELPLHADSGEALPDAVKAVGVLEEAGSLEFYGSLLESLERAGGYRRAVPGQPVDDGQPRQYAYLYDWRRDLAEAARGLEAFIEQLRRDHADPTLKVDVVAHSGGGLVLRHFLLYGDGVTGMDGSRQPSFAGLAKVRSAVAIGVPELGMAYAVQSLATGETIGLNRIWPSTLTTCQAPFQFLPHGDDTWLVDAAGKPLPADPFDVAFWRDHRLSVFNPAVRDHARHRAGGGEAGRARLGRLERALADRLERARRFRAALRAAPLPREFPYFVIAGNCRATLARLVLERRGERSFLRSSAGEVQWPRRGVPYARLMVEDGDGTVTAASSRGRPRLPPPGSERAGPPFNARWERFVCASHNQLVVNPDCQRALLLALGN